MPSPTTPRPSTRRAEAVSAATAGDRGGYRDRLEATTNVVAGWFIQIAAAAALRALGLWDAPLWAIATVFVAASWARSYALRRAFRAWEQGNG